MCGCVNGASLVAHTVRNLPAAQETWVQSLGQWDPLEKGVATHSRILAWRVAWTEEPRRLPSMGSQRVGHDWETNTTMHICMCITNAFHFSPHLRSRPLELERRVCLEWTWTGIPSEEIITSFYNLALARKQTHNQETLALHFLGQIFGLFSKRK